MTRIFDFDYPELTSSDLLRELVFVKTAQNQMAVGVLWFLVSAIYLLMLNLYAICLVLTFELIYLGKFYTIAMGILFMSRLLLGSILESLV